MWYQAWLDGKWLLEGPFRYALNAPEYQTSEVGLCAGYHVLAFHARHEGVDTRILKDTPPFVWCLVRVGEQEIPVAWKAFALDSQASGTHRINPQLGWIDCRDTRCEPVGWERPDFDDLVWGVPGFEASALPDPVAAKLANVQTFSHELTSVAEGPLVTTFGYPADEPAYVFFARDRVCRDLPAKGLWRRYDLGRVRLGRAAITLDVSEGTVVEIAYAEDLTEGRVAPFINLSCGPSCNMDRFIARGGEQTFSPLMPKGGRFLEIHVVNARERVRFVREEYFERGYHAPSGASFSCGDPLLEKICSVGIETYRACAEDALIDNPTRERGQWVGDVAAAGMEIASVAFHDLRLCRRALVQAAQCSREDGLVAGMSPGACIYLPTYAFQWTVAAEKYFRHTGDHSLLEELWPQGLCNMEAIHAFWQPDGLHNVAGWNFVDWGYQTEEPVDTACNLHYLWALQSMIRWAKILGCDPAIFVARQKELSALLAGRIQAKLGSGGEKALGYHCAALALRLGLISDETACLDYLQSHLLACFPNDPAAPRNDDPNTANSLLITPYFAHYVMPLFIERGRMDFVLGQYRRCWGWMLEGGRTTWLEVFDARWSHSHQWSGCPTWQLFRYVLGLHPRLDLGADTFDFLLFPGSLTQAKGRLPHPSGGWIDVEWHRTNGRIRFSCRPDAPLCLRLPGGETRIVNGASTAEWIFPENTAEKSKRHKTPMEISDDEMTGLLADLAFANANAMNLTAPREDSKNR